MIYINRKTFRLIAYLFVLLLLSVISLNFLNKYVFAKQEIKNKINTEAININDDVDVNINKKEFGMSGIGQTNSDGSIKAQMIKINPTTNNSVDTSSPQ